MSSQPVYKTIDTLPVKRWFDILKTGEISHLYISGLGVEDEELLKVWEELQQQYFDEFGIDDNFKIKMQKMQTLTDLYCTFIDTNNRSLLNHINQLDFELRKHDHKQDKSNYKLKDSIEKHRKYHIDLNVITVVEWYHMVRDYEEEGARLSRQNRSKK